jgi:uncharacterized protein (TIGR02145 family)
MILLHLTIFFLLFSGCVNVRNNQISSNETDDAVKQNVWNTEKSINKHNSSDQNDESVTINGVKWATCNVDAPGTFAANPEDAGMFYQWNRKVAWSSTGNITDWDATTPEGDVWEKTNDPCPAGWRLPSNDDISKLLDTIKVGNKWTTVNGINGIKFTDKVTDKFVFFPAVGFLRILDGAIREVNLYGYYWSSMPNNSDSERAYRLVLCINYVDLSPNTFRKQGFNVRCVADR